MTRKRSIGGVAAIGGMTATIALLTGLPAASADELADLRANQELLQRRIEQLAQRDPNVPRGGGVPGAYGTEAIPGQALAGGSFPRSFLIPGTDTSIRVGGQITEVVDYWLQNGPINGLQSTTLSTNGNLQGQQLDIHGQFVPGLIPGGTVLAVPGKPGFGSPPAQVNHSRGNGVFLQSPRETRFNVETRTPTAWGEARTFLEWDFAGCNSFTCATLTHVSDNLALRFRYAYGTLGGFLAGQANSNFSDPDANGEVLDFGGPIGQAGVVRIPQVRYTIAGPWGSAWSVSAETPETDIMTPVGPIFQDTTTSGTGTNNTPPNATTAFAYFSPAYAQVFAAGTPFGNNPTKNVAPDVTFASYWSQPWGHVDFKLVGRDLTVTDGRFFSRSYFGYGGSVSGDVKPGWLGWAKDDFTWQFTAGNGIGRYLNDQSNAALATNYLATPASQAIANSILFKPIAAFGYQIGYQHWWLPNLRSNVNYGYAYYDVPTQLVGPSASMTVNKELMTAHVNLIWSPVAFVDTGIEYIWGQRKVLANIYGTQQALIGKFQVKF